ncbi:hypothetical protein BH11MYX4_BH11MYX4_68110 [soil metagenome]
MARSDRKRLAFVGLVALAVPTLLACNAIIGLSDFEKVECAGTRCGDGGGQPDVINQPDVVVSDAPIEARGANPVSWAAWPMPNYDGGAEFLPHPIKYAPLGLDRVKDTVTGLVWRTSTLPAVPYEAAKLACSTLDPATGPWRLPKRIELVTLLDFSRKPPAFLIGPEFTNVKNVTVWTSSEYRVRDLTDLTKKPSVVTDAFWTVDFKTGAVDALSTAGDPVASVLCVGAK